jgi:DNA-binding MarR family transcriptional regulator
LAKHLLALRARRVEFVSADLLGEPAWDMLLALFVANLEKRRISVSEVALTSGVPTTTALRWMDVLQNKGLIRRIASPDDARVTYVVLEADGHAQMAAYLKMHQLAPVG